MPRSRTRRELGRVESAALGLLLCLACACNGQPQAAPSGPAPSSGPQARGYVADSAFRPLSGVRVEVVDGPTAGTSSISGSDGWFLVSIASDRAGEFTVRATRAGYVTVQQSFRSYTSSYGTFIDGYVSLTPTDPPAVFEPGAYSITLDFPCTEIPADLRTQTFPATVAARPNTPPGTDFIVSIDDERFRQFNYTGFEFGVSGSAIGVREDEDLWWEAPVLRYFETLTVGKVATPGTGGHVLDSRARRLLRVELPEGPRRTDQPLRHHAGRTAHHSCVLPNGRLTLAPRQ